MVIDRRFVVCVGLCLPVLALAGGIPLLAALPPGAAEPSDSVFAGAALRVPDAVRKDASTATFVTDRGHVSIVELTGNYDQSLADGTPNLEPRMAAAREYFAHHADDLDFLVVVTGFEFSTGEVRAFHIGVRNDVMGLGLPLYDGSADFGSAGRLRGYVDLAALSRFHADPLDPEFETTIVAGTHEVLHQWAVHVHFRRSDGSTSAALTTPAAHWSFLADTDASVLYGNDWRDDGNGTFTSVGALKIWSPLDLYLAGFLASEEVPPIRLLNSPGISPDRLPEIGAAIAATSETVTVDDVIAAEGPRIPDAAHAPHEFRAAVLYLVRPGHVVGEGELQALERLRTALADRFAILTAGRGRLEVHAAASPTGGTGSPSPTTPGGELRPEASVVAGLSWLRSQQLPDGSWLDKATTQLRDTAVVATALAAFDPVFTRQVEAKDWLAAAAVRSTDHTARRLGAIRVLGGAMLEDLTELRLQQNADGGWGLAAGYASDPLDTALGALALWAAHEPADTSPLARAAGYLLASQNADGGWGPVRGGASRTAITAQAIEALEALGGAATARPRALAWLAGRQNPDGGFGDSPSTAHDTAQVLLAALAVGVPDAVNRAAAMSYLLQGQSVAGDWEGSAFTTARAVTALQRLALPNWRFLALPTADPASPREGERLRLRLSVTNDGAVATPAGVLRAFDGDPEIGGVAIGGDAVIPVLVPGVSTAVTLEWETAGRSGEHELVAVLDPDNATVEASEADNRAALAIRVQPADATPDLAVAGAEIAFLPPHPAALPVDVTISVPVRNLGSTAVSDVAVDLWLGPRGTGELVGRQRVSLLGLSSVPVAFSATITLAGSYLFTAVADPDQTVVEASETNNEASASLATGVGVDLAVATADLALPTAPVYLGADVVFGATLHNRGTATSTSFSVLYEVTDGATTRRLRSDSLTLTAGESRTVTVPWRVDLEGPLSFVVRLDSGDLVPEVDESNNVASLSFTASRLDVANLAVTYTDVAVAPDPALQGQAARLSASVRNNGGAATGAFEVRFYDGEPTPGHEVGSLVAVAGLGAGESTTASTTWPAVAGPLDRLLFVVVDPGGSVTELTKADNTAFRSLAVLGLPDAVITPASLRLEPSAPAPGQTVALTVDVTNPGEQALTDLLVQAFLGDPAAGGIQVGGDQLAALVPAGGAASLRFAWTLDGALPATSLVVVVDPSDAILEQDETNNRVALPLAVQDANAYVSERYFSPNGDGVADSTVLFFRLAAPTDVALEIRDHNDRVVRHAAKAEWRDTTGGRFEWDGREDSDRPAPDGDYQMLVVEANGTVRGRALTTLDTNRESLLASLGSRYESERNLTCDLGDTELLHATTDERQVFFVTGDALYPYGIYRMGADGDAVQEVVPQSWFWPGGSNPSRYVAEMTVAEDGSAAMFVTWTSVPPYQREAWIMRAGDSVPIRLGSAPPWPNGWRVFSPWPIGFYDQGHKLLYWDEEYDIVSIDTAAPQTPRMLVALADGWYPVQDEFPPIEDGFSPDRTRLLLTREDGEVAALGVLDLESGTVTTLRENLIAGEATAVAWAPDGSSVAFASGSDHALELRSAAGDLIRRMPIDIAQLADDASLASPAGWELGETRVFPGSHSGWDVAVEVVFRRCDPVSGVCDAIVDDIVDFDLATGRQRAVAHVTTCWSCNWPVTTATGEGGTSRRPRQIGRFDDLRGDGSGYAISIPSRTALAFAEPRTGAAPSREPQQRVRDSGPMCRAGDLEALATDYGDALPTVPSDHVAEWVANERAFLFAQLRYQADPVVALRLDESPPAVQVLGGWEDLAATQFSATRRRLLFDSSRETDDPVSPCYGRGSADTWALGTLANLALEIRPRRMEVGGFVLEGTAADRNFRSAWIDYARVEAPASWSPVAPPFDHQVFADRFTTWYPPGPGAYLLRLSGEDLAGNRRSVLTRVVESSAPSGLMDLSVAPDLFSPNGDGVRDTTTIHYRALQPLHLVFEILLTGVGPDRLVASIARDHPAAGEYSFAWDGRGDDGQLVADGLYRVRVSDLEQLVQVDKAPPVASIGFDSTVLRCNGRPRPDSLGYVDLSFNFGYGVSDASCTYFSSRTADLPQCPPLALEAGEGETPAGWQAFPDEMGPCNPDAVEQPNAPLCHKLPWDLYEGHRLRVGADDLAGNRTVAISALAPQGVFLGAVKTESVDSETGASESLQLLGCASAALPSVGDHWLRFELAETIVSPVVQAFVRYGVDGILWSEEAAAALFAPGMTTGLATVPDRHLEVRVDTSNAPKGDALKWQVRLVDLGGQSYLSNIVAMELEPSRLSLGGGLRTVSAPILPADSDSIFSRALAAGRVREGIGFYYVAQWSGDEAPSQVTLHFQSAKDPRYATERRLLPVFAWQQQVLFEISDWNYCTVYEARALAHFAGATVEVKAPRATLPCLALEGRDPEPVLPPTCSDGATEKIRFWLRPIDHGAGLGLVALTVDDGASPPSTVYTENRPAPGQEIPVVVDVSSLADGTYRFTAKLTDFSGSESFSKVWNLTLDRTPTALSVTKPTEGESICSALIPSNIANAPPIRGFEILGSYRRAGESGHSVTLVSPVERPTDFAFLATAPDGTHAFRATEDAQFSGPGTLRLEVDSWRGKRDCLDRSLVYDGQVEPGLLTRSATVFSPNGDSRSDTVDFTFNPLEPVAVDIGIYPGAIDELDPRPHVEGPLVRSLASGVVLAGRWQGTWDGLDDRGALAPDRMYVLRVHAVDGCGNERDQLTPIDVDSHLDVLEITYPGPADPLAMVVGVVGSVQDPRLVSWSLDVGAGSDPTTWIRLRESNGNVVAGPLGLWNIFGLQGSFTLRLAADDQAGNHDERRVTVLVVGATWLLSSFEAVPWLFSPNGDGRRESTAARLEVQLASTLEVILTTPAGALVRTLARDLAAPPGALVLPWDGRADAGAPAPDGVYQARVHAALASQPAVTQDERVVVVLDRTPPAIDLTRPDGGFADGNLSAWGSITDERLVSWSVALTDTPASPVWRTLATGAQSVESGALGDLGNLPEGDYALRVQAEDAAENRIDQTIPFTVDNTPPVVSLIAPADGALVGVGIAPIQIRGAIDEDHLRSWRLEIGAGPSPTDWTEMVAGAEIPASDMLLAWGVAGVADGPYSLRLVAEDRAGHRVDAVTHITVDNTPPSVAISAPSADAFVREPLAISGSAMDLHLIDYALAVAPTGSDLFSAIGGGAVAVDRGVLLSWQALPPDGTYRLQLTAHDGAGNLSVTELPVQVDTHAPAAPVLSGELAAGDARLSWTAGVEPDVVGYLLERDSLPIGPNPIAATTYLDAGLAEGIHRYVVVALDRAGWRSAPSNAVELAADRTPPLAQLLSPPQGGVVSGLIDVLGTAYSATDFGERRLSVRPEGAPLPGTLLAHSPLPVQTDLLGSWSTVGLAEGAAYSLRLEAEDHAGNVAVDEHLVTIDNRPPAAPTGLTAAVVGTTRNVQASWNGNAEPDLLGYLLYRDGRLVNAAATALGDLRQYALASPSYLDLDRPDGTLRYVVEAIDRAGNVSAPSNEASATIADRAPHAVITTPAAGTRFDAPLAVVATCEDTDVASVRFQLRAAGATTWTDLGGTDTSVPWETTLDPTALGLAHGDYELRAVATDTGGFVDPAPTAIGVTFTDLTAPSPPSSLAARSDGGDVNLTWAAVGASDLAGYIVERSEDSTTWDRLSAAPQAATNYLDAGRPDGVWRYRVLAADTAGEESPPSSPAEVPVWSPTLEQPYTPTAASTIDLIGASTVGGSVSGTITTGAESVPIPAAPTGPDGSFAHPALALSPGDNAISIRVTDGIGNRSRVATVYVLRGERPSRPTGLTATAGSALHEVDLAWNANPEPDLLGYRPRRNGTGLDALVAVGDFSGATASSELDGSSAVGNAIDGDPASAWRPWVNEDHPVVGQWLEVDWAAPRLVSRVEVHWLTEDGLVLGAADFAVEGWDGRAWVPIVRVHGNTVTDESLDLPALYRTDRIRLRLSTALHSPDEVSSPIALSELAVFTAPITAATARVDVAPDGSHSYTVSAVGDLGLESDPSEPAEIAVGDVEPPPPVVLAATVAGSDVHLDWTPSLVADLARYDLYRDGAKFAEQADLATRSWIDAGQPNGTHRYVARAVDAVGNASAPSNEVAVVIAVGAPEPPLALTVTVPARGGALDLAWQANPAGNPAVAYRVLRGTASGGPYAAVGETSATTYADEGLTNGITYFYVASALDSAGNASNHSNEAGGTPHDSAAPPAPELDYPTVPGAPVTTAELSITVAGKAMPGARVDVYRGVSRIGSATVAATDAIDLTGVAPAGRATASPDGRRVWASINDAVGFFDFATHAFVAVPNADGSARWTRDSGSILLTTWEKVRSIHLVDGVTSDVVDLGDGVVAVPSPVDDTLAIVGWHGGETGLFRVDPRAGTWSLLRSVTSASAINGDSVVFSPDGGRLAFVVSEGTPTLESVTLAGGATTVIDVDQSFGVPSFSADSEGLVWTSQATGDDQIHRYDFATGETTVLTSGPRTHSEPRFAPTGRYLAWVVDGELVERLDLATGQVTTIYDASATGIGQLEWTRSGELVATVNGGLTRIEPAGRFRFDGVALAAGENVFTGIASDAAGNASELSAAMIVRLTARLPDLAVLPSELVVLPQTPLAGGAARITATVRNLGDATSPPTTLDLWLAGPAGYAAPLAAAEPIPALAPGGSASVAGDLVLPLVDGEYRVTAAVDAADAIREADEANDFAERPFLVAGLAAPTLSVTANRATYAANDTLLAASGIENPGATFSGRLELFIEDDDGVLVASLLDTAVADLAYGQRREDHASWPVGTTFAGNYQLHGRLRDAAGDLVAEARAPFAVGEMVYLTASAASDRATYEAGVTARLTGSYRYSAGNALVADLTARLRVVDAVGSVVAEWAPSLGSLLPGASGELNRTWSTVGRASADYQVEIALLRNGETLATGLAPFAIVPQPARVTGDAAAPSEVAAGDPLPASAVVRNTGGQGLASLAVRLALVDPATGIEVAAQPAVVDLPAGGEASLEANFASGDLGLRTYTVVLEADLPMAGGGTTATPLDVASVAVADRAAPLVRIAQPADGGLLGASLELLATAVDERSPIDRVELALDGGAWQKATLVDAVFDLYRLAGTALVEGEHTVAARAADAWGNVGSVPAMGFVVDLTPPVIVITGVAEGGIYRDTVTPVVTVTDLHPGWWLITLDDLPHVSGAPVSSVGLHRLRVYAEDAAGNRAQQSVAFEIQAAPTLPSLSIADAEVVEGDGSGALLTFVVTLTPASNAAVAADFSTIAGSATAADDFTPTSGTLTFAPQETMRTVVVPITGDEIVEPDETLTLHLESPNGATLVRADATGTIRDDDHPGINATKVDALAVDADGNGIPSPSDTIEYTITIANSGSALLTGINVIDPIPTNSTLVAGSVTTTQGTVIGTDPVNVAVGDMPPEGIATIHIRVQVDSPVPAGVVQIQNQGTLSSNELAPVSTDDPDLPGVSDPTVTLLTATPRLTLDLEAGLAVDHDGDGVASPGDELLYQITARNTGNVAATSASVRNSLPAALELVPGSIQSSQGAVVTAVPLRIDWGDVPVNVPATASFRARVTMPFDLARLAVENQAFLATAELADVPSDDPVTLALGDPTSTPIFVLTGISISDTSATEGAPGASFLVTLDRPSNRPTRVMYATSGGSAQAAADFVDTSGTLTIDASATSGTVVVPLVDDGVAEGPETFRLILSSPENGHLATIEGTATVLDDDEASQLVVTKSDALVGDADGDRKADAGDEIEYTLVVAAAGGAFNGLRLTDPLPPHTVLVPGSLSTSAGNVDSTSPIEVSLDSLAAGESAQIRFRLRIEAPLPLDVTSISNQASVVSDEGPPVLSDDPDTPEPSDATWTAIDAASVLEIPTLSPIGLVASILVLALAAIVRLRRRRSDRIEEEA